jgi:hypothetical protein
MGLHPDGESRGASRTNLGVLVLAVVEITLGAVTLYWCFAHGVHDDSSMGGFVFLWGTVAGLFALLIPGLLLLTRGSMRFAGQPFAVCFVALVTVGIVANLLR